MQKKTSLNPPAASPDAPQQPFQTVTYLGDDDAPSLQPPSPFAIFLASPRAMLVLFPLLVLALGMTLTIVGQLALSSTSKTMAKERFVEQTATATVRMEHALATANPVLHELSQIAQGEFDLAQPQSLRETAQRMKDLLVGRSAISQVYIAFPDSTFIAVNSPLGEREDGRDFNGTRTLQLQVTSRGTSTTYLIGEDSLIEVAEARSQYDPTQRVWFQLAREKKEAIWSPPYAFYFSNHPGVTRALPIYADAEKNELKLQVGVDFDVDALTAFMAAGESGKENTHSVVFSPEGIVLAYPRGAAQIANMPRSEHVANHQALHDSELSDLIESVLRLPESKRSVEIFRYNSGKKRMLASVRRLALAGPHWYVASFADESTIMHELRTHRAQSLWIGGIALLVAMGLGWWLARYILYVRNVANRAQRLAERAEERVRDLGSYRLLALIGEGGMGEVWRARHRLLARDAAIKLIKLGDASEERMHEQRERFRREAQAIASLRSRHTVALFDYGVTPSGTLFYAMELLDGIDLSTLVSQYGPQPPDRVRQILLQACGSLAEAHDAGLVHRDIKPANLFLCREADEVDVVKVLDFGLVFQASDAHLPPDSAQSTRRITPPHSNPVTHSGNQPAGRPMSALSVQSTTNQGDQGAAKHLATASAGVANSAANSELVNANSGDDEVARITNPNHQLGTPAFMSPEQALGNSADPRSDIYSLGCVAWWLLTGQSVFRASSQLALMLKQIEEEPADLHALVPEASEALCRTILRCLQKAPGERPASARSLASELRGISAGGEPWNPEAAELWWSTHHPAHRPAPPNLSVPPLRDAELRRSSLP